MLHSFPLAKYPGEDTCQDQQKGRAQEKRQLRDSQHLLEGGIEKADDLKQRRAG